MLERNNIGDIRGTVGSLEVGDKLVFPSANGGHDVLELVDLDRRYSGVSTLYMRMDGYENTISVTLVDSFRVSVSR